MILRRFFGTEDHEAYQQLLASNLVRQYDFLSSVIGAAIAVGHRWLTRDLILALHHHAVACLDEPAGRYRTGPVVVNGERFVPPMHHHVPALMGHLIDLVNRNWGLRDPFIMPAECLWRLNYIHPFVNGNGRTARAVCHYVFCMKLGTEPEASLPALIRANRDEYTALLIECDQQKSGQPLRGFLERLVITSMS